MSPGENNRKLIPVYEEILCNTVFPLIGALGTY